MKALRRPCVVVWSCLTAALLSAGCQPGGPPRYVAAGTILFNDKPLTVTGGGPGDKPGVELYLDAKDDPSKAAVQQICSYDTTTGKFKTTSVDDKGVEAGRYRVVVTNLSDAALNAKYGRGGSAPVFVEVKGAGDTDPAVLNLTLP